MMPNRGSSVFNNSYFNASGFGILIVSRRIVASWTLKTLQFFIYQKMNKKGISGYYELYSLNDSSVWL